jgi:hypothetical protein
MTEPSLALDRAAADSFPASARPSSVRYSPIPRYVQVLMRWPCYLIGKSTFNEADHISRLDSRSGWSCGAHLSVHCYRSVAEDVSGANLSPEMAAHRDRSLIDIMRDRSNLLVVVLHILLAWPRFG